MNDSLEKLELADFILELLPNAMLVQQPLGFYRFFLDTTEANMAGTFVHLWMDDINFAKSPSPSIHAHTFDMQSTVLCGAIENRIYTVEDKPNGSFLRVNVHYNNGEPFREVTDVACEPTEQSRETIYSGGTYSFGSDIFHSTHILEYPVLTFMRKNHILARTVAKNIIDRKFEDREVGFFDPPEFDENSVREYTAGILNSLRD